MLSRTVLLICLRTFRLRQTSPCRLSSEHARRVMRAGMLLADVPRQLLALLAYAVRSPRHPSPVICMRRSPKFASLPTACNHLKLYLIFGLIHSKLDSSPARYRSEHQGSRSKISPHRLGRLRTSQQCHGWRHAQARLRT
jgi:hypothetical protein